MLCYGVFPPAGTTTDPLPAIKPPYGPVSAEAGATRRNSTISTFLLHLTSTLVLLPACTAAVTRIDLIGGTDIPGYAYERIAAKAHFAIDPANPANTIIRDLSNAPRNENGLVEFAADLFILKPRDLAKGNGVILFEVSNRGHKGMLSMFDFAVSTGNPSQEGDFGDGYLLKQGYTLVWVGWQADVPLDDGLMRLFAPVAKLNGQTITGPVRSQWVVDTPVKTYSLGDRDTHIPYPLANPDDPAIQLTIQDHPGSPRRAIPRSEWRFAREENGRVIPDNGRVYLASGYIPGKIYEMVYTAKDPTVAGLGPAAIRDLISFLKYENDSVILPRGQSRYLQHAIGFGTSQSGRFLRTFLYYGFNRDEKNRKVFDGVWAHVAGAGRGSFNHRFAQPSRDGHPLLNLLYPTDIFPFTDEAQSDPETGLTGGLLVKAARDNVAPKIFYTNGSYEYWGRAAALIHTSIDGASDMGLARDSRSYFLTGTQHGPGSFPPRQGSMRYKPNPNDYRYIMRGLMAAMCAWVKDGKEPPPSQIPLLSRRQLAAPSQVRFPKLPGVTVPKSYERAWRANYGPEFRDYGIVSYDPPKLGNAFPTLVPQVDAGGNETAGVRLPEIQVPLGTYTGWNLRTASIGNPDELFSMVGSFFAFAPTKAERLKRHDPRLSIEERYSSRQEYLARIKSAAAALVSEGYILARDVPALEQRASREWDALAASR